MHFVNGQPDMKKLKTCKYKKMEFVLLNCFRQKLAARYASGCSVHMARFKYMLL
jgi:hypothetical protein